MGADGSAKHCALLLSIIGALCAAGAAESPGDHAAINAKIASCGSCHGADGNSTREGIPSLAGQPETFLVNQLILIREGVRRSEIMRPQVRGLDDNTIIAIARYFSALPPRSVDGPADPALAERGRAIAKKAGCGGCHKPDFAGRAQIPRLAGQREDYLAATLAAYRDGEVSRADTTMIDIMHGYSDGDIRALAHFLAHRAPDAN